VAFVGSGIKNTNSFKDVVLGVIKSLRNLRNGD